MSPSHSIIGIDRKEDVPPIGLSFEWAGGRRRPSKTRPLGAVPLPWCHRTPLAVSARGCMSHGPESFQDCVGPVVVDRDADLSLLALFMLIPSVTL